MDTDLAAAAAQLAAAKLALANEQPGAARQHLKRALNLQSDDLRVLIEAARLWRKLGESAESRRVFQAAIKIAPDSGVAWNGLGATWVDDKDFIRAERCFRRALRAHPGLKMAEHNLADCLRVIAGQIHTAARHADWTVHELFGKQILAAHRARRKAGLSGLIPPFNVLGFQLTPEEQRDAAESVAAEYLAEKNLPTVKPLPLAGDLNQRRIRIGYLSPDFRNNALAHLIHRLFALHDRERFEIFAYSMGADDDSFYRNTIRDTTDHFADIADEDTAVSAKRIRHDGIDILIDLIGFAGNHRAEICARRPAPIQVFWLGYCCTTGAPWIDYFVTDPVVTPPASKAHFSEKLIRLPDCYQMYCGEDFLDLTTSRAAEGLPEEAMVYCSFNITDKIDPSIFARWMAVLEHVPGSVLWLIETDHDSQNRLRQWAEKQSVDPQRLIFAPYKPKREHLARTALADLFLDTTLFGAHTTASDALWAGVPVLTCPGELFAQRVAASVCTAAGLPDLIVSDMDQYQRKAIRLGQNHGELNSLKRKLAIARPTAPLFDNKRFARELEAAYLDLINQDQAHTL